MGFGDSGFIRKTNTFDNFIEIILNIIYFPKAMFCVLGNAENRKIGKDFSKSSVFVLQNWSIWKEKKHTLK